MTSFNDLPGPPNPWWGFPLLRALSRDYLGTAAALRKQHGEWVRARFLHERTLDLFDPEALRALLVEHHDALIRWERGTEVFAEVMGQSVLVTEGASWARQRRILVPAFAPAKVRGYATLMREAADARIDRLQDGELELGRFFSHITMDVMLRTLFGTPAGRDTDAAAEATAVLSEAGFREFFRPFTLPDWLPLPGKAAKRRALRTLRGLIRDGLAAADGATLAAQLRATRSESGEALAEQEVFDTCMVSFQAGHETSSTALLWWSWLMATHPDVQARVIEELRQVLQGKAPSGADALPLLDATLKEAMRLYPPAAALLNRRLTRNLNLRGVQLPKGLLVRLTTHTLHHDPARWPEPTTFRPERWLPGSPAPERGSYLPFGTGPRVCLGQHFAQQEMQLVAARLLQRFRLEPLSGEPPPLPQLRITLRPAGPLRVRCTRHLPAP